MDTKESIRNRADEDYLLSKMKGFTIKVQRRE